MEPAPAIVQSGLRGAARARTGAFGEPVTVTSAHHGAGGAVAGGTSLRCQGQQPSGAGPSVRGQSLTVVCTQADQRKVVCCDGARSLQDYTPTPKCGVVEGARASSQADTQFSNCLTTDWLGESLHLPGLRFLICNMRLVTVTSQGCYKGKIRSDSEGAQEVGIGQELVNSSSPYRPLDSQGLLPAPSPLPSWLLHSASTGLSPVNLGRRDFMKAWETPDV